MLACPSREAWKEAELSGSDASPSNHYAHVNFTADPAAPPPTFAQADLLQLRHDSCEQFPHEYVHHVLSEAALARQCTARLVAREASGTFYFYEVRGRE